MFLLYKLQWHYFGGVKREVGNEGEAATLYVTEYNKSTRCNFWKAQGNGVSMTIISLIRTTRENLGGVLGLLV